MRKIGLILTILLVFAFMFGEVNFVAAATVTEPSIEIYGDLTKDVKTDNILEYSTDEGDLLTLDYEVRGNLTIDLLKIQLEKQ